MQIGISGTMDFSCFGVFSPVCTWAHQRRLLPKNYTNGSKLVPRSSLLILLRIG